MTLSSLCPTLDEMVRTQMAVGKTGRTHYARASLSTANNLRTIHLLMEKLRPERTLEVGLSFGGSALAFCASHQRLRPPKSQHIAIDPFQTTQWDECGLLAIERAGLSGYLEFRPGYSATELPSLMASDQRFGLIYVDGSHLFEDVFVDAYYGARMLAPNGIIAFDDSTDPHVAKVIKFIRRNLSSSLREIDLSEYSPRPWRNRIASVLSKVQLTAFGRIGAVGREWNAAFCRF